MALPQDHVLLSQKTILHLVVELPKGVRMASSTHCPRDSLRVDSDQVAFMWNSGSHHSFPGSQEERATLWTTFNFCPCKGIPSVGGTKSDPLRSQSQPSEGRGSSLRSGGERARVLGYKTSSAGVSVIIKISGELMPEWVSGVTHSFSEAPGASFTGEAAMQGVRGLCSLAGQAAVCQRTCPAHVSLSL